MAKNEIICPFIERTVTKNIVGLLILLFVWIGGSSYAYVCVIRKDCCEDRASNQIPKALDNQKASTGKTLLRSDTTVSQNTQQEQVIHFNLSRPRSIPFDYNSSQVQWPETLEPFLDSLRPFLQTDANQVLIEGHTDHVGSEKYNLHLSKVRAEAVKEALVQMGVPAEGLLVAAMGESNPVADNETTAGRALNRRVEIKKP